MTEAKNDGHWTHVFNHCKDRAKDRFGYVLTVPIWFDMWNKKIHSTAIKTRTIRTHSKRSSKGVGRNVVFDFIPGIWIVNRSGMPLTCIPN